MMRWLAEQEPQIEAIDTWNAESNDHMIAVNERLGYRVVGRASWSSSAALGAGGSPGSWRHQATVSLAATSNGVVAWPSSSSLRPESSTNGRANW